MCRSARAGVAASRQSTGSARGVMRMNERTFPKWPLAGRMPPNGRTLALLCLKFVKHRDLAENRRKNPQAIGKPREKCRAPCPAGLAFRRWDAIVRAKALVAQLDRASDFESEG